MKHISKLIFITLLLTAFSNSSYSESVIELNVNDSNHLVLSGDISPDGTTELGSIFARKVIWHIQDNTRIQSIYLTSKYNEDEYPFEEALTSTPAEAIRKRVRFLILSSKQWNYNIIWTDAAGIQHTYDPKIAVKPGKTFATLIALIAGMLGVFFIGKTVQKRNAEKKLKSSKITLAQ